MIVITIYGFFHELQGVETIVAIFLLVLLTEFLIILVSAVKLLVITLIESDTGFDKKVDLFVIREIISDDPAFLVPVCRFGGIHEHFEIGQAGINIHQHELVGRLDVLQGFQVVVFSHANVAPAFIDGA